VAFVAELHHCSVLSALEMVEMLANTYPEVWGAA
jgi:hypothetical protein